MDAINAGIYIMQPEALDAIPTGRPVSIERETYPKLLEEGAPVYAVALDGYWLDIGRAEQYRSATEAILNRDIAVEVPGEWTPNGYWAMEGVEVDPTTHVAPTVHIGKNARVGAGASISGRSVIGPDCRVGANSTLTDCILEEGVIVGDSVTLTGVILDNNTRVEDEVRVTVPSVFASNSLLAKGTAIAPGRSE